jgi:hypothetical protein
MKRTRSDAKWNGLSQPQQEMMEQWLLEENLDYETTRERAETVFGFEGSASSVQRFCARKKQERLLWDLVESGKDAAQVGEALVSTGALRAAGLTVLAQQFFRRLRDAGITDAGVMGKLLLDAEANEIQRERNALLKDEQELRRQRLVFQQQQWQCDVVAEAKKLPPELTDSPAKPEPAPEPEEPKDPLAP